MTLYEKRGRRYVPVAERDAFDGIPLGWYLVNIRSGGMSARRVTELEPDHAALEAAMVEAEGAMVAAMNAANVCAPDERGLSREQIASRRRGWKAWMQETGEGPPLAFRGVSMIDVVRAGLDAVRAARGKPKVKP